MWLMSLWDVQHKQRAKEIEFGFCSRECLVTRCLIFAHLVGIVRSFFFHKLLEKRRQFCNPVFRLVVGVWANCMRKSRTGMDRGALNKHLAHGLELIRFWTIAHHHWGSDISLYMMQCIIVGNLACWMPQWEWITNAFHSLCPSRFASCWLIQFDDRIATRRFVCGISCRGCCRALQLQFQIR